MLVGCGQRLLAVFQHAHEGEDLFSQPLVLVYDSGEVFAKVPQFRLSRVYALVPCLDDSDDLGKVLLCWRCFLG